VPITDSFGQGFQGLDYGDVPDLKVLSQNLLGIVGQAMMRFTSASARNATITNPQPGMIAWLIAEKQLTVYDGFAWVVVAAGTQSWTTIGLVSGYGHNGNSNGTFQYRLVNLFGEMALFFRGGINVTYTNNALPNGGILNSSPLPSGARPTTLRTITVPCSDASSVRVTLKLDVQADGYLKIVGAGKQSEGIVNPPWIAFNGCFVSL